MKSLKESLFDKDLVSKDVTFGDLFEWVEDENLFLFFKEGSLFDWSCYLNPGKIKKDSKIDGKTPNETIYNGLLKLIKNIKITSDNMTTDLFEDYLTDLIYPYYQQSLSPKYRHASVQIYKNGRYIIGREQDLLDGDFDIINLFPCQSLCLKFKRK